MPDGGPRIQGFSYRGLYRYSLTVCVHSRRKVFDNAELVAEVLNEIQGAADIERFEVLTYCFMPDHVHLLIEGKTDDADLHRFIKTWKQRTGFKYAKNYGRRLWQVGYFDHVLRSDEDTYRHALYMLGNPVRAGLTQAIGEYPYAGWCQEWVDFPKPGPEA